jgi:hypothetical protein
MQVRLRDSGLSYLKVEADLDPLRDEPRFSNSERGERPRLYCRRFTTARRN